MIDIRSSPSTADCPSDNRVSIVLFAALAFVAWDSGYLSKWFPSQDRTDQVVSATAVLLIKSPDMTVDQQYTASSPVLDEIADQRGIDFRVIDDSPGEISGSPEWLKKLFLRYESKSPCIAVMDASGNSTSFDAPSSVADFRKRIGAK